MYLRQKSMKNNYFSCKNILENCQSKLLFVHGSYIYMQLTPFGQVEIEWAVL